MVLRDRIGLGINENKNDFLDELIEVAFYSSSAEKRSIRYMGVHTAMILLISLGRLCNKKIELIDELNDNSQKTAKKRKEEAKDQIKYLKSKLKQIRKQVLISRSIDVMLEIRLEVADTLLKITADETLYLIIDNSIAKTMGQLLYDKNKTVKKRALKIAAEVLEALNKSNNNSDSIDRKITRLNSSHRSSSRMPSSP